VFREQTPKYSRYAKGVNYAQLLFPDFSLILCGYFLCRFTGLNRNVWQQAEFLVYYFLFPVLFFHSIAKSPLDIQASFELFVGRHEHGLGGHFALSYSLPLLAMDWRQIRPQRLRCHCPNQFQIQLLHCFGIG
jgi:malonate transporter and related proteins